MILRFWVVVLLFLILIDQVLAENIYSLETKNQAIFLFPSTILLQYSLWNTMVEYDLDENDLSDLSAEYINSFDKIATNFYSESSAKVSDYLLYSCLVAPFFLNLNSHIACDNKEVNLLLLESYFITYSIVSFSKSVSKRKRPLAYNNQLDISIRKQKDNRYSFFSGHTALAFAGAISTAKIYADFHPKENTFWFYSASVATASTVGLLRIRAGKHFPSDVIVGAAVGTATPLLLTEIQKNTKNEKSNANSSMFYITINLN